MEDIPQCMIEYIYIYIHTKTLDDFLHFWQGWSNVMFCPLPHALRQLYEIHKALPLGP